MIIDSIKIRWIYATCYEIVLPNNKVILLDPYISPMKFKNFNLNDITGADYILCTHTHYDHTMDTGTLSGKFGSKILVEYMGALPLAEYFNIPCGQIYSLFPNDCMEFEDFKLEVFRTKHVRYDSPDNEKPENVQNIGKIAHGIQGYEKLDKIGTIASLDFLITTRNNIRILISSGDADFKNTGAKKSCPNILIRQASRQGSPKKFAEYISKFGAQVIFPHHHENISRTNDMTADEYIIKANTELKKISPYSELINPEQFEWYHIGVNIDMHHSDKKPSLLTFTSAKHIIGADVKIPV